VSGELAAARRARIVAALRAGGFDRLAIYGNSWQSDYLRYVTDFGLVEGHGIATIDASGAIDFYLESAADGARALVELSDVRVHVVADATAAVRKALHAAGGRSGGAPYHLLPRALAHDGAIEIANATALVDALLMRKLPEELAAIRRSAARADDADPNFREAAQPGRRQYEIVADVEGYLRSRGCAENFMLLGSGGVDVRGMVPPSERALAEGDMVTTELTPETEGYYAQICRTLIVGKASDAQRKAFAVFHEALEAGIATVRAGVTAGDVARAENDVFRKYGLEEYTTSAYTRVRGHGLGLFPDSKPHVLEDVTTVLEPGMTIVVHPNTYHPAVGYIVLGDSVIVTETGCEVLTGTARALFESAG
jgi:Xaa-Pro aminopeptidase